MKNILTIASISAMLAVMLGAFGAHGLKNLISTDMLEVYKTGVQYHFYHSFALFIVGILMHFYGSKKLKIVAWLFIAGIVLFSGSLYILAITGIKIFGIITPFGGTLWIIAWLLMAIHFAKLKNTKHV